MIEKKELVKASSIIFNYVLDLEDNEINDLIEGNKNITLIESKEESEKVEKEVRELQEVKTVEKLEETKEEDIIEATINKINKFTTREEAKLYLRQRMFTVKLLKVIAKESNIYVRSKSLRTEIIDKIIEATIGARVKHKSFKED